MSSIEFDVDITNPGQFYACLGLLSVADILAPGATGRFDNKGFLIVSESISPADLIEVILEIKIETVPEIKIETPSEAKIAPVTFLIAGHPLLMNWWCKWKKGHWEKTAVKLWGGHLTSRSIPTMLLEIAKAVKASVQKEPKTLFKASQLSTRRYGIDPDSSWNALNVGFSPNEHGGEVITRPYTEILAAIGLQFAVPLSEGNIQMSYYTWKDALPLMLAALAARGVKRGWRLGDKVVFEINDRGSLHFFGRGVILI